MRRTEYSQSDSIRCENTTEDAAVDVAAGQYDGNVSTTRPFFLLEQCRKRGSAAALGGVVGVREESAHRRFDLIVRHPNDPRGATPSDCESRLVDGAARHPVRDSGG